MSFQMEFMVFPLKCLPRSKCLVLLLVIMALAFIGFQLLILLPQSSIASSATTITSIEGASYGMQRPFAAIVDAYISKSNDTKNDTFSESARKTLMKNAVSKASLNVSPEGNTQAMELLKDNIYADYSRLPEDEFFNRSDNTALLTTLNSQRSDTGISQGIHGVESNASVSKLESSSLHISLGKVSNWSTDFFPDGSGKLMDHSELVSHVKDGHVNVNYSIRDGQNGSSGIGDGRNGSSQQYKMEGKISSYLNLTMLQNASATMWSSPPEAFELLLEKGRGVSSLSLSEMNMQLMKNLASPHSNKPHWHSAADKEILRVKARLHSTRIKRKKQDLYPLVFRNISFFKRSYELMEQMLKVYIYPEGERPAFHQPDLKGIYASEGWFMKLLDESKLHVKDPWKAHLFYLPFSSSALRYTRAKDLNDKNKLAKYLKDYVDLISRKYPFWNRTGGVDHFFAACHDWAPYTTEPHMNGCIRALCNADVSEGFELGKDVSLPETYIHVQNPDKDIGGKPAKERSTFAFFTGVQHGYLRQILLQLWENKDPDMKISTAPFRHAMNRKDYANHMRASKYCICARGYEVNSPRVVEAILYECVPVIISDNFVPPFFKVLDWRAFSIFIAEKDIRRLKEILVSIPERRYLSLQKGVRKVQRHFLWHRKPVKYDIFHMILHSVWLSRLNRIRIT